MSEPEQDERESDSERAWDEGHRMALLRVILHCTSQLGINDPERSKLDWIAERSLAVSALRRICEEHGDNDWPDNLALPDVIRKHLHQHLEK